MAKTKTPEISFQALAAHEEFVGLTSIPATDLIKRLHQNKQIVSIRYTHDGEQILTEKVIAESVPEIKNNI
jgi:hypothetical protein